MLKRFLPRQDNFFESFQKTADIILNSSSQFHAMMHDLEHLQRYVDAIAAYEEEGDKIAHSTFESLHKTFITPFDRHDIHRLISSLDDILDCINRCAQRFPYYQLKKIPEDLFNLTDLSVQACLFLKKAIYHLHSLKNTQEIFKFCEDINYIESKAHQAVLTGEKILFSEEKDFKNFFKLKEIYAQTKSVINGCQDIANLIKGIVLEYS